MNLKDAEKIICDNQRNLRVANAIKVFCLHPCGKSINHKSYKREQEFFEFLYSKIIETQKQQKRTKGYSTSVQFETDKSDAKLIYIRICGRCSGMFEYLCAKPFCERNHTCRGLGHQASSHNTRHQQTIDADL